MEQSRKYLKLYSIVVLVLAVFFVVQAICELSFGETFHELSNATIPEGAPENIVLITRIFLLSFSLLLTLPHIYIGIKGLRIAKNPNASKGHIIWAIILLAFACLGLIDPIVGFVNNGFQYADISAFFSIAIDIMVFVDYIKYATAVRKKMLES